MTTTQHATTLGELSDSPFFDKRYRSVSHEIRENLIRKLRAGETVFDGIVGYSDTVVPEIENALLSRHHFILLGLRGQAKSRIARSLTEFLDEQVPAVAGCEIHDNPYAPICRRCKQLIAEKGDATPISWLGRSDRYVEKLATPDVTIADMIGDLDPIRAAKSSLDLSDELTIHYGLVPRAHRGIFAINELPDLAAKIQVGLFNILQEGDIQIKGFPIRLPLDLLMVFTANPEDYTARGRIVTPLKDRIGAEIRTHYPGTLEESVAITRAEAWTDRQGIDEARLPYYIREVVDEVAIQARQDRRIDRRSGVSQRLPITLMESVVSSAERRALLRDEGIAVPRITDVYASLPSITGKLELEYEGELKGAAPVSRELIRRAVGQIFQKYVNASDLQPVIEWFDSGGFFRLPDTATNDETLAVLDQVPSLLEKTELLGVGHDADPAARIAAAEFLLEGLAGIQRISRNEERGYHRNEANQPEVGFEQGMDDTKDRLN